jgi:hypothetical protein
VLGSKLAVMEPRFAVAFCLRIAAPKRDFNHNRHGYSGREHVEVGAIGEAGALGLINSTTASAIAEMASPQLPELPHSPHVPPQSELPQKHARNNTALAESIDPQHVNASEWFHRARTANGHRYLTPSISRTRTTRPTRTTFDCRAA